MVFFLCLLKVEARYYALLVLQEACTRTRTHTHTHTHTLAAQHFIPFPRIFQQKCLLLLVQPCDNFHLYQVTESYVSLSQDDLFPSHPQTETIRESNVSFSSVAWKR